MALSRSRTKLIAYAAVFAAPYVIFRVVPVSMLIGSSGFIPLSNALTLTYALLLGPVAGSISVVLGTVIAYSFGNPPIFLGLDFLTPLTAVLAMSLMARRKHLWVIIVAFAALLVAFNLSPMTLPFIYIPVVRVAFPLTWLHFIALAVLIAYTFATKARPTPSSGLRQLTLTTASIAFVGLLLQQLVGSYVLYEGILGAYEGSISSGDWAAIWRLTFLVYPFEWVSLTIVSVLIAVPVYGLVSKRFATFET